MQLGVVSAVSVEKGRRGERGVLLKKGTGPGTVCLQYPPGTPFRRVSISLSIFLKRSSWPSKAPSPTPCA